MPYTIYQITKPFMLEVVIYEPHWLEKTVSTPCGPGLPIHPENP
jgi:hypothetical protein